MIAVDTNVLLRYLLQDDKTQSAKANKIFTDEKSILITDVVLIETIWTLKGKKYQLSKENLLKVIDHLFKEPGVFFEDGQTVWRAFNIFRNSKPTKKGTKKKEIDFPDILILEKARHIAINNGLEFSGLFSFDSAAQELDEVLKP